jgi:hypothetical protein
MRNKKLVQRHLSDIESIQQSFIQFVRNSSLSTSERETMKLLIDKSKHQFAQIRSYLNQERDEFN